MNLPSLNSTQVPNVIFDYWMNQLTPGEFKVLLCICRKTYGWHKMRDSISLSQIVKMTGLSRRGVVNNLTTLEEHGLVQKDKSKAEAGDNETNYYEIHLEMSAQGSELSSPPVVNSVHHGVVNSVHPQKKDYTKERPTKKKGAPAPSSSPPLVHNFRFGKHVVMSQSEFDEFISEHGQDVILDYLQQIDDYISSVREKPYKDFAAALRNWMKRDEKNGKGKGKEQSNAEFAHEIAENYNLVVAPRMQIKLEAFSDRIEIYSTHPTSNRKATVLRYSENGFKDQVENALRKWGLK